MKVETKQVTLGLTLKAVQGDERRFTGVATTATLDRYGEVVLPKGAVFQMPVPLLAFHKASNPVGTVVKATVSRDERVPQGVGQPRHPQHERMPQRPRLSGHYWRRTPSCAGQHGGAQKPAEDRPQQSAAFSRGVAMKVIALKRRAESFTDSFVREPTMFLHDTDDGLGLHIVDGERGSIDLELSPQQAIDVARHLFTNALRLSAHTANGRMSASIRCAAHDSANAGSSSEATR
jgi:hypothetical protein